MQVVCHPERLMEGGAKSVGLRLEKPEFSSIDFFCPLKNTSDTPHQDEWWFKKELKKRNQRDLLPSKKVTQIVTEAI